MLLAVFIFAGIIYYGHWWGLAYVVVGCAVSFVDLAFFWLPLMEMDGTHYLACELVRAKTGAEDDELMSIVEEIMELWKYKSRNMRILHALLWPLPFFWRPTMRGMLSLVLAVTKTRPMPEVLLGAATRELASIVNNDEVMEHILRKASERR